MSLLTPRARRIMGMIVGVTLLLAAAAFAARAVDLSPIRHAQPWQGALLAVGVAANVLLAGLLFWAITCPFDAQPKVPAPRMVALIALSGLLNYLPLPRPGLVGRTAYLKAVHRLPVRQSLLILGIVLGLSVVVLGAVTAAMLATSGPVRWGLTLAVLFGLTVLTGPVARWGLRRPVNHAWLWVPLRAADLAVAAGRLWVAFSILGQPIDAAQATLAAAGGLLVKLAGLTPNGLGLSEWVVGLLAAAVSPVSTATGTAAALIDRAAEAVVMTIAGLLAAWRLRLHHPNPEPEGG